MDARRAVEVGVEPDVHLVGGHVPGQRRVGVGVVALRQRLRRDRRHVRAAVERAADDRAAHVERVRRLRAVGGLGRDVRVGHDRRVGRVAVGAGRARPARRWRSSSSVAVSVRRAAAVRAAARGLRARVVEVVVGRVDRVVVTVAAARAVPVAQLRIGRDRTPAARPASCWSRCPAGPGRGGSGAAWRPRGGRPGSTAGWSPCTHEPLPLPAVPSERYMPPSLPRKTRFGVAGLPSSVDGSQSMPCWSACGPLIAVQVVPPLVDVRSETSALKRWFWSSGSTQTRPNHHSKPLFARRGRPRSGTRRCRRSCTRCRRRCWSSRSPCPGRTGSPKTT